MLDKHGLRAPSTHVGTETLDNVDRFVDEAKILGHTYLILADVPSSGRQSLATFAAFGAFVFIAQYLQLIHAAQNPEILDTATARVLCRSGRSASWP